MRPSKTCMIHIVKLCKSAEACCLRTSTHVSLPQPFTSFPALTGCSWALHSRWPCRLGACKPCTAQADGRPRFHPALLRSGVAERANGDCPGAPCLQPILAPGHVEPLWLPPIVDLGDLDPSVVHVPQPQGSPWSYCWPGPSPRLYWALFFVWRHRWSFVSGLSGPVLGLLGIYIRSYLFREAPPDFLAGLQQLLQAAIPMTAMAPRWFGGSPTACAFSVGARGILEGVEGPHESVAAQRSQLYRARRGQRCPELPSRRRRVELACICRRPQKNGVGHGFVACFIGTYLCEPSKPRTYWKNTAFRAIRF